MCGLRSMTFFMRFFLFLFTLFLAPDSFALSGYTTVGGSCYSSPSAACIAVGDVLVTAIGTQANGCYVGASAYIGSCITSSCGAGSIPSSCIATCNPSLAGASTGGSSFGLTSANSFCNPVDNCLSQMEITLNGSGSGSAGTVTNGQACLASPPSSSTSPTTSPATSPTSSVPSSNCPSGYSPADSSGCVCSNGSGSYTNSNNSLTNPACTGGAPVAPTYSPVAPTNSGGSSSCPPGSSSIGSGSSLQCFVAVPSSPSSPTSGGGSGGNSGSPTSPTSSGSSPVGPTGSSGSGSGTAPTSSGTSAAAPTASAASAGVFVAPTGSSTASGLSAAIAGMSSSTAFSSIGFGSSWLPQTCPPAPTLTISLPIGSWSHTFTVPVNYVCEVATDIRSLVLASGGILSLLILAW